MIETRFMMTNTTEHLNRRQAAAAAECRDDLAAIGDRPGRTNLLPARALCAVETAAPGFARISDRRSPALNSSNACKAVSYPALPWRNALLKEEGLLLENLVYSLLVATVAVSLLLA